MDRSQFIQLLTDFDFDSVFSLRVLERGSDYVDSGRVLEKKYTTEGAAGLLIGLVQGNSTQPYRCGFRMLPRGRRLDVDTFCSCPVGSDCKHVAALVLESLGEDWVADDDAHPFALSPPQRPRPTVRC